jgi:hypothetical protein
VIIEVASDERNPNWQSAELAPNPQHRRTQRACACINGRFFIPLALDIERDKGKRDPDGIGMAPLIRVLP